MKRLLCLLVGSIFITCTIHAHTHNTWAEQVLSQLTLDEKIGQLLMIDSYSCLSEQHLESVKALIKKYHIGSIIFHKGNPETQVAWTNKLQALSKYPLLIAQDCEWGLSMRLVNTTRFPKNMTLGALQDESLIYQVAQEIGKHCRAIGVHLNFAPVVDINNNPDNPIIGVRSFGSHKEDVTRKSVLFAQGLHDGGVIACAKHFPGHGDTTVDSHEDLPVLYKNYEQLLLEELHPFNVMIDMGIPAIMMAHLSIPVLDKTPHQPSTLSRPIVTDFLRKQLKFNGLIVTDAMTMKGVTKFYNPGQAVLQAILAGNDLVVMPVDIPAAVACVTQAVENNILSEQELNEHVLRVLRAKEYIGLHENRFVNETHVQDIINSDKAKILKKKLYQQAVTLVRDEHTIIPIQNIKHVGLLQVGGQYDQQLANIVGGYEQISPVPTPEELIYVTRILNQYETVLVVLYTIDKTMGFFGRIDSISQELRNILDSFRASRKKVGVIACMSPYCLKFLEQEKTIIMAYENDPDALQAGLDVVMGKIKPSGKLPI